MASGAAVMLSAINSCLCGPFPSRDEMIGINTSDLGKKVGGNSVSFPKETQRGYGIGRIILHWISGAAAS